MGLNAYFQLEGILCSQRHKNNLSLKGHCFKRFQAIFPGALGFLLRLHGGLCIGLNLKWLILKLF